MKVLAIQVMKLVELRLRNKELKKLSQLQHKIASITANDVRNPLQALYSVVSLQEANLLSEEEVASLLPLTKVQLESTLLLKSTQRRAEIERITADISGKIGATAQFDSILRTAAEELSRVLGGSEVLVQLHSEALGEEV